VKHYIAPSIPAISQNPSFSPFAKGRKLRIGNSCFYLETVFASFFRRKNEAIPAMPLNYPAPHK
jgi:hypothetical protein